MLSSLYTHIILFIACALFLLSFLLLVIRLENDFHSLKLKSELLSLNSHQSQITFLRTDRNSTEKQINETILREKVLSTNARRNHSIFDRFTFINPPKPICKNLKDPNKTIIIIVLSRTLNLDYRQAIRATWGRKAQYKSTHMFVRTIFFVGIDDSLQSATQNEQTIFNDVVEIGIPESYPFMVYKELAALFWLRLYCPSARMLFRIDDDMLLDVFLLLKYIEHQVNFQSKDGMYGWFRLNNSVLRSGRWAVTTREYKLNVYPPYTLTIGYLFSNDSCRRLIDVVDHHQQPIIRISDAYITGILRDLAKIPFYTYSNLENLSMYYNEMSCDSQFERRPRLLVCTSKLHLGIRGDPYEYYDVWDGLLQKHNTTLFIL